MSLLDQFGNPIPPAPDPVWRERYDVDRLRDRSDLENVLADVTPARLRAVFAAADSGQIGRQIELAMTMLERDAHLASVEETRRRAALAVEWQVQPGDDSPAAAKAAEAFRETLDGLDVLGAMDRLQGAVLNQWHVEQVLWDTDGRIGGRKMWRPTAIEEVDGRRLAFPMTGAERPGDLALATPGMMRNWNPAELEPLAAGRFLCHGYRAVRGRPGKMALIRAIAFLWMLKRFGWVDFGTLLEQFGRPWRAIKYDQSVDGDKLRELLGVLKAAAADLAIAIPAGSELEFFQGMQSSGHAPHVDLIRLVDEAESKLLVGSTTISDAAQKAGSVSSPTHGDVRRDIRDADCRALARTWRRDLSVPWTLWNFGPETAAPKYVPTLADKPEPATRAAVYIHGVALGLAVQSAQLYRELGLERPAGVPDVIVLGGGAGPNELNRQDAATQSGPGMGSSAIRKPPPADGQAEAVLNGAQIAAAVDVMLKLREESVAPKAAVELIVALGIARPRAEAMVADTPIGLDNAAGDAEFKRQVLMQLLTIPAAREAAYNGIDMNDLTTATGLAPEKSYQWPWIPVVASSGPVVSGEVIRDPEKDVVGGAVIPGSGPAPAAPFGGARPRDGGTEGRRDAAEGAPTEPEEEKSADELDRGDAETQRRSDE